MSVVTDKVGKSPQNAPRRRVSIRRGGQDFVAAFQPEDIVDFRNEDTSALRKVCRSFRVSHRAVVWTLLIYGATPIIVSALWLLATPGEVYLRPAVIFADFFNRAFWLLILPGLLPLIFWAFGRFSAEKAGGPLTAWGLLGFLFISLAAIYDFYDGTMALSSISANIGGFFSDDYDAFVRVVRNSCAENQRAHPVAGVTAQQNDVFCKCYGDALARQLTAYELNAALARKGSMSPELRHKMMRAEPACRDLAFGR